MNKFTRIKNILAGVCILIISMIMLVIPDLGSAFALLILGWILVLDGIKQLIYFFSMGIHMVGGKMILYRALITLDLGCFTLSINGIGQRYIMFYFIIYYLFAGIVFLFRSVESKKLEAGSWKLNFLHGLFDIVIAIICLFHNNSAHTMLDILCFALIVSALTRIGTALRKSAIVYIP